MQELLVQLAMVILSIDGLCAAGVMPQNSRECGSRSAL